MQILYTLCRFVYICIFQKRFAIGYHCILFGHLFVCVADGKGRNDIMTVPRSMSINCPRVGNPSPIFLKSYPLNIFVFMSLPGVVEMARLSLLRCILTTDA